MQRPSRHPESSTGSRAPWRKTVCTWISLAGSFRPASSKISGEGSGLHSPAALSGSADSDMAQEAAATPGSATPMKRKLRRSMEDGCVGRLRSPPFNADALASRARGEEVREERRSG